MHHYKMAEIKYQQMNYPAASCGESEDRNGIIMPPHPGPLPPGERGYGCVPPGERGYGCVLRGERGYGCVLRGERGYGCVLRGEREQCYPAASCGESFGLNQGHDA